MRPLARFAKKYQELLGLPEPAWHRRLLQKLGESCEFFCTPENEWILDGETNFTVCHGDYRRDNFMYAKRVDNGEMVQYTYDLQLAKQVDTNTTQAPPLSKLNLQAAHRLLRIHPAEWPRQDGHLLTLHTAVCSSSSSSTRVQVGQG